MSADEWARAHKAAQDRAKEEAKLAAVVDEARDQARKDFEESEQGEVARQNHEAERIMHLSTPDALKEMGAVVGDPLKGPSS